MTIWCDCIAVPHKGRPVVVTGREQAENEREFSKKYLRVLTPRCAELWIQYNEYMWEQVAELLNYIKRSKRDTNEPHD